MLVMCAHTFFTGRLKVGDYKFNHLVHFSYEGYLFAAENSRGWSSLILCSVICHFAQRCRL